MELMPGPRTARALAAILPDTRETTMYDDDGTPREIENFNELAFVVAYEAGELDEDETIAGFQEMVNNGHAWQLQGHYGRQAAAMIEAGMIEDPRGMH